MELNREQVEKALDWLDSLVGNSNDSEMAMRTYQLLGILYDTCEELTEENERLHASCTELTQECKKWQGRLKIECEYTEAITVRKIQDKFALEYGTYTDKDFTKIVDVFMLLDQIAKDMLEGDQ